MFGTTRPHLCFFPSCVFSSFFFSFLFFGGAPLKTFGKLGTFKFEVYGLLQVILVMPDEKKGMFERLITAGGGQVVLGRCVLYMAH